MNRTASSYDKELFFRALADRTRLRLINLMGDDEVCVCFAVEVIGPNQPKISRHLAYLRRAGIVEARRQGTWMHYRLVVPSDADAARVLAEIREWLSADPEMREDRSRLVAVCCAPDPPPHLQGAPRPASIVSCGCP